MIWGAVVIPAATETRGTVFTLSSLSSQQSNPDKAVQVGDGIGRVAHTVESLRL